MLLCIKTRFSWLLTCGRVHSWHVDMWNARFCHRGTKSRFWDVRNTRVSLFQCFKFMPSLNCESSLLQHMSGSCLHKWQEKASKIFFLFGVLDHIPAVWMSWMSFNTGKTNKHPSILRHVCRLLEEMVENHKEKTQEQGQYEEFTQNFFLTSFL